MVVSIAAEPVPPTTSSHSGAQSRSSTEVDNMKVTGLGGLTGEDLRRQIVHDVAIVPGERVDELVGVGLGRAATTRPDRGRRASLRSVPPVAPRPTVRDRVPGA